MHYKAISIKNDSKDSVILSYTGDLVDVAKRSLLSLSLAMFSTRFVAVKFKNGKRDLSKLKFVQKVTKIEDIKESVQKFKRRISRISQGSRSGAEEEEEDQQDRTNDSHPHG